MSEFRMPFPACAIASKHRLGHDDLLLLRNVSFPDGIVDTDGAVTLLALHNSCPEKCAEWNDFFVESRSQFIVHHCYPQGSIDDLNAEWLVRMISSCGIINSTLELDLLLHVIDMAAHVPERLTLLALAQLDHALDIRGSHPVGVRALRPAINERDMRIVHTVLRACAARSDHALTAAETSRLLSIDARTNRERNHPGWSLLTDLITPASRAPAAALRGDMRMMASAVMAA